MIKLEEIAPYLPYGLTGKHIEYTREGAETSIVHATVMAEDCISFKESVQEYYFEDAEPLCEFYPLLRPLTDLTREIEHNGERFVPIVRLYGLAVEESELMMFQPNMRYISEIDRTSLAYAITKDMSEGYQFNYLHNYQYFSLVHSLTGTCEVINQLQLFQKLFEWHFDVFGLIEQGDAIDINTLNK